MTGTDAFIWTSDSVEAFEQLKGAMVRLRLLALPDWTNPLIMETDASGTKRSGGSINPRTETLFSARFSHPALKLSPLMKEN